MRLPVASGVTAALLLAAGCSQSEPSGTTDPGERQSASSSSSKDRATISPRQTDRIGLGESLVLVIGGEFPARESAQTANFSFGEMQWFYAVPAADFEYLAAYPRLGPKASRVLGQDLQFDPASWLVASAFRTKAGAREFINMVGAYGFGDIAAVQVRRVRGSGDIGLGQEAAPDGTGPLTGPLENQQAHQ
jgi:hypothetical protein